MQDLIIPLLVVLAVAVVLFLILREVNMWYWKVNERISIQKQTNILLERVLIQLGAEVHEVTVEDMATGRKKKVEMDKWIEFKINNPKDKNLRVVKE